MQGNEGKRSDKLFSHVEAEQPSMRFTKNVMDTIDGLEVARSGKPYVKSSVVRLVFAIPMLSIAFICVYILNNTSSSQGSVPGTSNIALLSACALAANVLLIFIFIDELASRKRRTQLLSHYGKGRG